MNNPKVIHRLQNGVDIATFNKVDGLKYAKENGIIESRYTDGSIHSEYILNDEEIIIKIFNSEFLDVKRIKT